MNLPQHIQQFFSYRKISNRILEEFHIRWDGSRIVYPIFDTVGNQLFCNYRRDPNSDVGPRFSYDKGAHVALYGIHKIQKENSVLIVEGLNDMLVAWSTGIPAVTSTGGAMSFQCEWKNIFTNKDVTICLDSDEAGAKGMVKILSILPNAHIILLPTGIKDISDLVAGGDDLHKLIKTRKKFNNIEEVLTDKAERLASYESVLFHEAYEEAHNIPEIKPRTVPIGDDLARAKAYPITDIIKFNNSGFALCPVHNEKTGSLKYYPKQNRAHCFGGCGKSFDSIDIYQIVNNCSFKEAIKNLQ